MNAKALHFIVNFSIATFVVTTASGCAGLLPYNYMCGVPGGACRGDYRHNEQTYPEHPQYPQLEPVQPAPQLAPRNDDLSTIHEALKSLSDENTRIQEQLVILDKNAASRLTQQSKIVSALDKVVDELSTVRSDLAEQRNDITKVESLMSRNRLQNDQLLSTVEQQITDVLSELSN